MRLLKLLFIAAAAAIGPLSAAPAHAQFRVEVEGKNFVPVRIAVPDFDAAGPGAADAARQIGEIIRQDLAGSAVFAIVDKASFIEKDLDISLTPRFPDWTVGSTPRRWSSATSWSTANNNMTVQFRLYDVFGGQQQFATQYTVPTPLNWRRLAHKVADDIYAAAHRRRRLLR